VGAIEDRHTFVEMPVQSPTSLGACCAAFQMYRGSPPVIDNLPSGVRKPFAPIKVFAIHPISFIEQTHISHRFGPDEHESSID